MSFRNVGILVPDYTVSYFRRLQHELECHYPFSNQFRIPSCNSSFVIAVRLNANEEFRMAVMLLFIFYKETRIFNVAFFGISINVHNFLVLY